LEEANITIAFNPELSMFLADKAAIPRVLEHSLNSSDVGILALFLRYAKRFPHNMSIDNRRSATAAGNAGRGTGDAQAGQVLNALCSD
jgi:hypothetical protein